MGLGSELGPCNSQFSNVAWKILGIKGVTCMGKITSIWCRVPAFIIPLLNLK